MQNPINYPAVNYSITQDPYTKEFNISFNIKIKPDTVVKEIKTSIPSTINPLTSLQPINPVFGKSNSEIFNNTFGCTEKPTTLSGLGYEPLKPLTLKDLPTGLSSSYPTRFTT
jgi:hypothetical protein